MKIDVSHDWSNEMWDWPMQHNDGIVKVHNTPDHFEVGLECQFYRPDEIKVQELGDTISISCLHEERSDKHGTVKRELNRCYHLPPDVNMKTLKSHLDQKGILHISAEKKH